MNIVKIEARDIPDLWFQAVNSILIHGNRFIVDRGSYEGQTRLEFDYFTGVIKQPEYGAGTPEILPQIPPAIGIPNPVEFEYVYGGVGYSRSYIEYIMSARKEPGESYTYGERLCKVPVGSVCYDGILSPTNVLITDTELWKDDKIFYYENNQLYMSQIELAIATYKKYGHRNNQMVLQVAQPSDMTLLDPPCLRSIDTRIQNGKLHFIIYFRSWDLWGGLPANLAGIQALQQYMATEIGVATGQMIVESKGLHLYGYAEKLGRLRCMKN